MNTKNILTWASYDFANSLAFINVSVYFSLWLINDLNASDLWVTIPVILTTLILFFTLPSLGVLSDKLNRRKPFLVGFSIVAIGSLLALGITASGVTPGDTSKLVIVSVFYFLFQYFYQGSLAFYYSFIQELAIKKSREWISGIGFAAGQLGNIAGLLIALPIAQSALSIFGVTGKPLLFSFAGVLFLVFMLPTILFLKDNPRRWDYAVSPKSLGDIIKGLRKIRKYPGVLEYLVTFYLFADALLTLQLFSSLYLAKVGGFNNKEITLVFLAGLITSTLGGLFSRKLSTHLGGTKKTISYMILLWGLILTIMAVLHYQILFVPMVMLYGFAFGTLFSLSRAFFSQLVPNDKQGEMFSIYVLFERFASVLGPLIWSITAIIFSFLGDANKYRVSVFALGIIVFISYFTLKRVKEPKIKGIEINT